LLGCIRFEDLLDYEQPTKYIVKSTKYSDSYTMPVLTAGKSFIKGYTNETDGIFDNLPTIIFDDFTTATQFVDFKFKVKSSAMKILVPTSKLVNMQFVYHLMQVNQVRSDTHKRYWISVFSKKEILLPSLVEQKAIVKKIEQLFSSLDSGIADLKKAQEQLKIYRQAVLKKAFEGELTKEWRENIVKTQDIASQLPTADQLLKQIKEERQNHYNQQIEDWKKAVKTWEEKGKVGKKPKKPTQIKTLESLSQEEVKLEIKIPANWIYEKIGNITDSIVPNRDKPKSFNGDIHWLTTPNLNLNSIIISYKSLEKGLTREECFKYNARIIPVNSVIMTCVGMLGTSSVIEKEVVINQQLHAFTPCNSYLPKYLAYLIRFNKSYLERSSTATTVQYLNKTKCNSIPFPLCSIKEQHQIVQQIESRLSVCDKVEQSIAESLEKAKALRQSILKKAFEGKLLSAEEIAECKQAKDYEPASVLLERIKAEKEVKTRELSSQKKKPKKRKTTKISSE